MDITTMSNPLNLDLHARAKLLAYLVASHLLARQMTGEWLSVDHLVESTVLWLKANGGGADVMERVMLSARAHDIARGLENTLGSAVAPDSVAALFCENLRLDFRSPVARDIYQHCLTPLVPSNLSWRTTAAYKSHTDLVH
ncbi:hypothetical protein [Paraburkholderia kirstenboschensis]|uniref:HD domain-containing protein n=1 Tax=Paraburkholderia kirstenboschensis TaxID=1245436 RepID=A0ABZ0EBX5_9BURK|nr:hypothetical protein [Paraburkholderia kirstenboschensis]WOD13702.1 hypothetical protein RW095_06925 [Paraburkholderia kirstenboschensis]